MITNVYIWDNGMVMVFDQVGQQMPDYQGHVDEVRSKIIADSPESAKLFVGRWREYVESVGSIDWDHLNKVFGPGLP